MVGDGAATLVARAFAAAGSSAPPDALDRFLAIYDTRLLKHTRPYPRMPEVLDALGARAPLAVLTNKPLAATRSILAGLGPRPVFSTTSAIVGGDGPFPRKPDPARIAASRRRGPACRRPRRCWSATRSSTGGRRETRRPAMCLARYGFGFEGFPLDELGPGRPDSSTPRPISSHCRNFATAPPAAIVGL